MALSLSGMGGTMQAQKEQLTTASRKIIECIKNGDVACTSEFLATGGNANAVDEKGMPLLVTASETKSATVVRLLLNAGADPNNAGSGETPLCRAALFGRKEIAQTLLDAGAKANVICDADHGDSALMEAIRGAMFGEMPFELRETILNPEELRESADNEKEGQEKVERLREILAASAKDYLDIARMLLARGADVNVVAKCDVGESALMYAAMTANVEMVKTLLVQGADVEQESPILDMLRQFEVEYRRAKFTTLPALSRQQTALLDWTEKTKARRDEITQLLKAKGAKESANNQEEVEYSKQDVADDAREALDEVIESGDLKDFERLVAAYRKHPLGAAVLPNALRVAVIYSRVEMVKLLLERGVNPNTPSTDVGYTPLMQAAGSANLELVKMLIDAGADLNAEDQQGRTALDEAEMYTHSSEAHRAVVAFLKERGARNGNRQK
ncbi:MAG TPA: ankyrin repeat domain-containing protein [Pyrinomonadaceae bacterium]|nr:ankyrin repeat domain-containing protein [Pyrinomonadaceae bacterium]